MDSSRHLYAGEHIQACNAQQRDEHRRPDPDRSPALRARQGRAPMAARGDPEQRKEERRAHAEGDQEQNAAQEEEGRLLRGSRALRRAQGLQHRPGEIGDEHGDSVLQEVPKNRIPNGARPVRHKAQADAEQDVAGQGGEVPVDQPEEAAAPGRMRRSRLGSSTPRKKNSSQSAGMTAITNSAAINCAGSCGAATFEATVVSPSACRIAIQQAVIPLTKK
mgnify:CR=1 FL=1